MSLETHIHVEKGKASLTFGEVIKQTANNYPDERFRPRVLENSNYYPLSVIHIEDPKYKIYVTADGVGTKPELAERLYTESLRQDLEKPEYFEGLAHDVVAMVDGDEARFGRYMIGVVEIVDMNDAKNITVVEALARGLKSACDEGQIALLNGETAELGYRTAGYGDTRLNWNATGVSVVNQEKLIFGRDLMPGQPVVAFREESIRSNGLSKARQILETACLYSHGYKSKEEYVVQKLKEGGIKMETDVNLRKFFETEFNYDIVAGLPVKWHEDYPETTKELLRPSKIYGPVIKEALGKIDEPVKIDMVAAAHITGGGVPEKVRRMVENKQLGVAMDAVFEDPKGVSYLLDLAESLPEGIRHTLKIDDKSACGQWNRGIGFVVVARNNEEAKKMVESAGKMNCEAAIAGEVIDKQEIQFRNHTWNY